MKHKKTMLAVLLLASLSCQVSHVYPRSLFGKITKPLRVIRRATKAFNNCVLSDNFHRVNNHLYRSSQPSNRQLHRYIRRHRIKTIINLRGENRSAKWWREENLVAQRHNVTLVNIPTNSRNPLHKKQLKQVLEAYKKGCRKGPVLIHCQSGSDRTGAVAAILEYNRTGDRHQAFKQLSLKYGHIKARKPHMRRSVDRWVWCMQKSKRNVGQATKLYG